MLNVISDFQTSLRKYARLNSKRPDPYTRLHKSESCFRMTQIYFFPRIIVNNISIIAQLAYMPSVASTVTILF
jgi:hypothetical protein